MGSEVLSPETALKALAVLCAIPVVGFSIWADSTNRHLDGISQKKVGFDRDAELEKIRIAGFFALVFQFTIFLASSESRENFPILSNGIFCLAIAIQFAIQNRLEGKLKPTATTAPELSPRTGLSPKNEEFERKSRGEISAEQDSPDEILGILIRTIMSWVIGLLAQIFILFCFVRVGAVLAQTLNWSQGLGGVAVLTFGVMGVAVGLILNFSIGPIYMKAILPNASVREEPLLTMLNACFSKAAILPPSVAIIELDKFRITSVSWVGLKSGRGPFKPVLFISRWLLSTLTTKETEAMVMNQISGIVLNQTRYRFLLSTALIGLTSTVALAAVVVTQVAFGNPALTELAGPAVALSCFLMALKVLGRQTKRHQSESDLHTVQVLGVDVEDLISGLIKVDQHLQAVPSKTIQGETQARIDLLRRHFPQTRPSESHKEAA